MSLSTNTKIKLNRTGSTDETLNLSLVISVFNEEETVHLFVRKIKQVFSSASNICLEYIFVNDGSSDTTLDCLLNLQHENPEIKIVDLSRNFGKEAALSAGLKVATGQVIVPIDVDLQDPPEVILSMINKWREGYDVVLGRRINRCNDSYLKRFTACWFYRVHNKIADSKIPENVGDFRLMDRSVVDSINELSESHRFMKGLFAWVGYKTTFVDYVRPERVAGKTKFNAWKLWNFALEGLTGFSTAPLKIWTYIGVLVAFLSLCFAIFIIVRVMANGVDAPGYASLMVAITFLGGLQLIGIGVLGEYLGRTYLETKRRPVFLIKRIYAPENINGP